jgi:hypothetical protein
MSTIRERVPVQAGKGERVSFRNLDELTEAIITAKFVFGRNCEPIITQGASGVAGVERELRKGISSIQNEDLRTQYTIELDRLLRE